MNTPARKGRAKTAKVVPLRTADELRRERLESMTSAGVSRFCSEYVPISFVVDPIIRSSTVCTMTAGTGTGKTGFLIGATLAVATGRADILGLDVERGRAVYVGLENPDDLRMRFLFAAHALGVDLQEINRRLIIIDRKAPPEKVIGSLSKFAEDNPISFVAIDTLAAFYDGRDVNDSVEGGNFIRRIRRLVEINGSPAVLIAAHPVKDAKDDNLKPYGSGAILNEVDGNLTLLRRPKSDVVTLHWQGKFRGPDFTPLTFRHRMGSCPAVLDAKRREVLLPILTPCPPEERAPQSDDRSDAVAALMAAMRIDPAGTQRQWAKTIGKSLALVGKTLRKMERERLAHEVGGRWKLTADGAAE